MKVMLMLTLSIALMGSATIAYKSNGVDCDSWAYQGRIGGRRTLYVPRAIRQSVFTRQAMARMPLLTKAERRCVRAGLPHVFQLFEDACTGKRVGSGPPELNKEIGFDGALYASIGTLVIRCKVEN
jgi:hypothetical protein